MIPGLPFDVIFTDRSGTETVLDGWKYAVSMGLPYYETFLGEMKFSVQMNSTDQWYLKVVNLGASAVSGFSGIRFPWKHGDGGYTLIPGIYYDGNYHEYQKKHSRNSLT